MKRIFTRVMESDLTKNEKTGTKTGADDIKISCFFIGNQWNRFQKQAHHTKRAISF